MTAFCLQDDGITIAGVWSGVHYQLALPVHSAFRLPLGRGASMLVSGIQAWLAKTFSKPALLSDARTQLTHENDVVWESGAKI